MHFAFVFHAMLITLLVSDLN